MFGKNKPPIAEQQQTDFSSDLLIDVRQMSKIYNEGKENEVLLPERPGGQRHEALCAFRYPQP